MRIARAVCPQSISFSAPMALVRDSSLKAAGTASSRSRNTRSAPQPAAFSNMLSLLAGTASSERRSNWVNVNFLLSQHATGTQVIDLICRQAEQLAVDLAVVLTEARTQPADIPGRRGESRNRSLHRHRPELFIVNGDEHPAMSELLVGDQIADVVDGRGGHLMSLE